MFSNHNGIKLEINTKDNRQQTIISFEYRMQKFLIKY